MMNSTFILSKILNSLLPKERQTFVNIVTPELIIFWVFPVNPGVQTNFYSDNFMVLH